MSCVKGIMLNIDNICSEQALKLLDVMYFGRRTKKAISQETGWSTARIVLTYLFSWALFIGLSVIGIYQMKVIYNRLDLQDGSQQVLSLFWILTFIIMISALVFFTYYVIKLIFSVLKHNYVNTTIDGYKNQSPLIMLVIQICNIDIIRVLCDEINCSVTIVVICIIIVELICAIYGFSLINKRINKVMYGDFGSTEADITPKQIIILIILAIVLLIISIVIDQLVPYHQRSMYYFEGTTVVGMPFIVIAFVYNIIFCLSIIK